MRHTNTPAVMRWLDGVAARRRHEAAFGRIKTYEREHGHTFWIVERKSDGALLGFCGLKRVNNEGAPYGDFEVGWRCARMPGGRAMPRKRRSRASTLPSTASVRPTSLRYVPANEPSQGLMKRLGMTRREGHGFRKRRRTGGHDPVVVYRIEADEWPSARASASAAAEARLDRVDPRAGGGRSRQPARRPTGSRQDCRGDPAALLWSGGASPSISPRAHVVGPRAAMAAESACCAATQLCLWRPAPARAARIRRRRFERGNAGLGAGRSAPRDAPKVRTRRHLNLTGDRDAIDRLGGPRRKRRVGALGAEQAQRAQGSRRS